MFADPITRRDIARLRAEAWDEGYRAAHGGDPPEWNPYRGEGEKT